METYSDLSDQLPPRLGRGIGQMEAQTKRMQSLVNDLLLLSRLEIDQGGKDHQPFAVGPLLESIRQDAVALSSQQQGGHAANSLLHNIDVRVEGEAQLVGSEQEIRSAISNLAFNAVRYTPAGSQITLSWTTQENGSACIAVEDNGEGIDPVHIPRLTERFY
ncbi:ATP-binding protein, partial [Ralstonia pseudosolanacearum]|uniref:ATP-binding protein n=1 Tax=Ralstonia pseudosolanacearum TaxID=1310165 RepID=UPI003D17D555